MSGEQCFSNPPKLSSSCGEGSVEELGGLKTYVTGPREPTRAILLIHDAFGYEAPNLRKLSDKVAAAGFLVVVPDFFYGDPVNLEDSNFDREKWKKAHDMDKGCEDAKTIISAIKNKGISAIGAAGFCWGGSVAAKLAKFDIVQAAVVLHPGRIKIEEINEVKIPVALLGAEIDQVCPPEEMRHLGDVLAQKPGLDSFVKIFPGVSHGWTMKYKDDDEAAVRIAEEAHLDMLNWLTKYVK